MPVFTPVAGKLDVCRKIGEAFGINFPWSKLVIEIDVSKPVMVYVKAPAESERFTKAAELFQAFSVADVTVADDATVTVTLPTEEAR